MNNLSRMKGKRVLVTGAGTGIGKEAALEFCREGADAVFHYSGIAKAAVFLASDDARYIVGQTLIIDGGTTSWMPFGDGFRRPMDVQFGQGYVPGL